MYTTPDNNICYLKFTNFAVTNFNCKAFSKGYTVFKFDIWNSQYYIIKYQIPLIHVPDIYKENHPQEWSNVNTVLKTLLYWKEQDS